MRKSIITATAVFLMLIAQGSTVMAQVRSWTTTSDGKSLLARQKDAEFKPMANPRQAPIIVDDNQRYQQMEGFGFALTGGSAELLMKVSATERKNTIRQLFSRDENGAGINYIRLTVGASDMNSFVFSYDDIPEGQKDFELKNFSLAQDLKDVVPIMKEILSINPDIPILASPWSAPAWMKEEYNVRGFKLRRDCYEVYARYFVKYIQEMKKNGITIGALTVQNEPLNSKNTPSMPWDPEDQKLFIRDYLGPQFAQHGIQTKIILFDHNCDRPDYPLSILADSEASRYVAGSAFHHYMGDLSAMSQVHAARPDKDIYFTEQMIVDRNGSPSYQIAQTVKRMIIDVPRNWSRAVVLWNLAADPEANPHTDNGGCPFCMGAITIDGDIVTRNIAYYTIAQVSKFVPTGAYRIYSTSPSDPAIMLGEDEQHPGVFRVNHYDQSGVLPNVAFLTPEGEKVLIVSNTTSTYATFSIQYDGKLCTQSLPSGAVGTYVWK